MRQEVGVCVHTCENVCTVRECVSSTGCACMGASLHEYRCECVSACVQV